MSLVIFCELNLEFGTYLQFVEGNVSSNSSALHGEKASGIQLVT